MMASFEIANGRRGAGILLGVLAAFLLHSRPGVAQEQGTDYVQASAITQVVNQWAPDKHLYLIGHLPETSASQLRDLAGWLKGKHWYVVLARSADGQSYTDIQGGRHSGVAALDFALGKGIGLKDGFENLKHPRTGEPDGAVFGLYLDNHKLFLRTSEAQDRRGLSGEQHFAGDLDQWAKKAMRSAGPHGVVAAVRETVSNIDARLAGQTQQLVEQARVARGWVAILWALAQERLKQVHGLVEPGLLGDVQGWFLAGNYRRALGFENEKVTFRPDDEALLRELFGKERTWEDKLLGSVREYAPLEASFMELVDQLNANIQTVLKAIKEVESCALGIAPKLQSVESTAAALEGQQAAVTQAGSDILFLVPSLFTSVVPAARSTAAAARTKEKPDPVGAYQGEATSAERMVQEGQALATLIVKSGAGVRAEIRQAAQALKEQGIATGWIEAEIARLSAEAEASAAAAVTESVAPRIAGLDAGLRALGEKSTGAQKLAQDHARILKRIAQAHDEVAEARKEISQKTGVAPDKLLKEKGWKVDNKLYHAQNRAEEAAAFLGEGNLDGANDKLEQARKFGQQVSEVVEISLAAARAYRTAVAALAAEAERIATTIPEHRTILEEIRAGYATSVLSLGASDANHPNANATIDDNIAETEQHLKEAAGLLQEAEAAFKEGRVLETADLLNQAKGQHALALHRLGEIKEKRSRLHETEQANNKLLQEVQARVETYRQEIEGDARTMKPTLEALERATQAVKAAAGAVQLVKGDPFAAQDELQAAQSDLEHVHGNMARNDRDIYSAAEQSLSAAAKQMVPLTDLVREATSDDVPDSKELTQSARAARRLGQELKWAQAQLGVKHGDWHALNAEADRISAEAGRLVAMVKGEMEKAAAAVDQISAATRKVEEAGSWSGPFGVQILGAPGDQLLGEARGLLARGLYFEAQRKAESACRTAEKALADAEAAVAEERERRRRIEEERRTAEAKRRRAAARRSASSDDSSTSWGTGGFFGSGNSGGGGILSGGGGGFTSSGGGSSDFGGFSSSGGGSSGW